jgi:ABC-type nitrate/sulfonate/bicarbonate transport system substrate-binding protein
MKLRGKRSAVLLSLAIAGAIGYGAVASGATAAGNRLPARASAASTTITIALSAVLPAYAPLYDAMLRGYFSRAHLNVVIDYVGGANTVGTVVSGRADLAIQGSTSALAAVNSGVNTEMIYSFTGAGAAGSVYASNSIASIQDCKTMAVAGPATAYYAWAQLEQKLLGGKWTIAVVGSPTTVVAEVESGQADCGVMDPGGFNTLLESKQVHLVLDTTKPATLPESMQKFMGNDSEATIWGLPANLAQKRSAVVAFLKAFHRGVVDVETNSGLSEAQLIQQVSVYKAYDLQSLALNLQQYRAYWDRPCNGYFPSTSWANSVTFFQDGGATYVNPQLPQWSWASRVDMSYYLKAFGGKPKNCKPPKAKG